MTYPSQPGYPSPYGQQLPPNRQQNSLWLIGGSIVLVLVIIMTVILLVVQQTRDDSTDTTDGGSDGGGGDYSNLEAVPFDGTACAEFDPTVFADAVDDTIDEESSSNSASSGYVNCTYYTVDKYIYVNATFNDYDTADEVQSSIDYYRDTYATDSQYESGDYTDFGDDGFYYTDTSDPSYQMTDLRIGTGSLEIALWATYDATVTDADAVIAGLGEIAKQGDALFADLK